MGQSESLLAECKEYDPNTYASGSADIMTTRSRLRCAPKSSKPFLSLHKTDREQKCILDPDEVERALKLQADEITYQELAHQQQYQRHRQHRQQGKLHGGRDVYTFEGGDDGMSSIVGHQNDPFSDAGCVSETAHSELTTGTSATLPISNMKKYTPQSRRMKRGVSELAALNGRHGLSSAILEEVEEDEEDSIIASNSPMRSSEKRSHSLQNVDEKIFGTIEDNMRMATANLEKMQQRRRKVERNDVEVTNLYSSLFKACISPKSENQLRYEQHMSVLHLQMKAHLGYYYTQRFLPVFPDAPRPEGLNVAVRRSDEVPSLVSDDSVDSSQSGMSQMIEYGSIPPSSPIHCTVTDSIFMDLSISGSLGLVPRNLHQHRKARRKFQKSPDHYIVLMNRRSGTPSAVCALKASGTADDMPVVRIYATKQRVFGQRPAATTKKLGLDWSQSLPLYAWAEIVTDTMFPDTVSFSIFMASGSDGRFSAEPNFRAEFDSSDGNQPKIHVLGKTDKERKQTGCAIISLQVNNRTDEETNRAGDTFYGYDGDSLSYKVDIAKGIDPALLICFTSVVDEVLEKSMRLQCRGSPSRQRTCLL